MSQALYRKWRPQTFDQVAGQDHIVRTLRNALRLGHLHHAYLFAGPRGTGKTTSARLIAKAANCLAPLEERPCNECEICRAVNEGRLMDLIEIDAASHTGVDNVRDLLEKVNFRPTQARYKVYVIDEVHMLSTAAFNALLKTLEEPPEHVIFVLATTEIHKVPATVLSRCQRFEFRRIPVREIVEYLETIVEAEGIEAEPEALDLIARAATGSMRDAISLLDQLAADVSVTADYVRLMLGAERREVVQSLARAWLDDDLSEGLETINRAMDGGADPRQLARQLSDFLRGLLLMRLGAGDNWTEPTAEERPRFEKLAQRADPERLVQAVRLFSEVAAERNAGWQPQLPLELAFVQATLASEPEPAPRSSAPATARRASSRKSGRAQPQSKSEGGESAPEAPTGDDGGEEGEIPVEAIDERWREVQRGMRRLDLSLSALLNDARPVGVGSDGSLVLAFRHRFHLKQTDTQEHRRMIEELLDKMFNRSLRIRCVLEEEWKARQPKPAPAPRPAPPPAEPPENSLEEDEVVRRAVDELGAVPKVAES